MRPRLLDLFCGAGGAAAGYHWMTNRGMTEAIPPRYTEWVGHALMEVI